MHARRIAIATTRNMAFEPRFVAVEDERWSRPVQWTFLAAAGALCWAIPLSIVYLLSL